MSPKLKAKLEAIAQLSAAGVQPKAIRERLKIPLGTYKRHIARPEYRERLQELLSLGAEQLKAECDLGVEAVQAKVREELPQTVDRLLSLRGSKNERVALEACKDLLDRDPSRALVKVSRTATAAGKLGAPFTAEQWKMLEKDSTAVEAEMRAARTTQKPQ